MTVKPTLGRIFADAENLEDSERMKLIAMLIEGIDIENLDHHLFNVIAARFKLVSIQAVVLRQQEGRMQVLLTKRPKNDEHWPEMYHVPGTIVRSSDELSLNFSSIPAPSIRARLSDELGMEIYKSELLFTCPFVGARGKEISFVYLVRVGEQEGLGEFFDVNKLPETFIQEQWHFLDQAVNHFYDNG